MLIAVAEGLLAHDRGDVVRLQDLKAAYVFIDAEDAIFMRDTSCRRRRRRRRRTM
jgi:hypothetical protein